MASPTPPVTTSAQLDAILAFLPRFEQAGDSFGEGSSLAGQGPLPVPSAEVGQFVAALYANGFIEQFDWPAWQPEAQRLFHDPQALSQADQLTLRRLFTVRVRKDRFVEGYLAAMLESGHVTAILRRLAQLRARRA